MRTLISEGVYIDTYNLHADAGTEPGDLVARAANLQEVSDYINVWSVGNAVLVFGDTNSRYTRSADIPNVFATNVSILSSVIYSLAIRSRGPSHSSAEL